MVILIVPTPDLCIEDVCLMCLYEPPLIHHKQGTIVGMTMMALADRKAAKTGEWVVQTGWCLVFPDTESVICFVPQGI